MKMTILEVAIHPENENPVFGERSTHVRLSDEAGGSFVTISQSTDNGYGEIRLDFEEIETLVEAIKIIEKGKVD